MYMRWFSEKTRRTMESEAAGCLENGGILSLPSVIFGWPLSERGEVGNFTPRRWSLVARLDTLILSLPVRLEHHTPLNKTPPASGARSPDPPRFHETNFPQILPKAI